VAYWVIKAILTPLLRLGFRLRVEGLENVPRRGPVILAANHRSFMDSLFLPLVVPRRVTFVAKAEYFDDWRTAWFFRSVGQIPIRREGGTASEGALGAARQVLTGGGAFGIYPEGTRTRSGYMHRGHTGVARLALQTGAPLIPVGMVGTDEVQPTDRRIPRFGRPVTIRFGRPVPVRPAPGAGEDRLACRRLTDELMFEIRELSGYEYVDTYATRSAETAPAPGGAAPTGGYGAPLDVPLDAAS